MSKDIVVPGEVVSQARKKLGAHVYIGAGAIRADVLGIKSEYEDAVSVVPLKGKYVPVEGDVIVGVVTEEKHAGYMVELNSFYPSFISKMDVREHLKPGTVISAKVMRVDELNEADISGVRVLYGGEIVQMSAVKVPRLIGKNASMLNMIQRGTNAMLVVGRNGLVWVKGEKTRLALECIRRVERLAHMEHLTNDIQSFIEQQKQAGAR